MSCYHPFVCIIEDNMLDPKQREIIENIKLRHKFDTNKSKRRRSYSTTFIPFEIAKGEGLKLEDTNAVLVPCGRCVGCRLDYSRIWAERCVHEASKYDHNYFLTLTYDDDHLPKSKKTGIPTLLNDEISDFIKALRQHFKRKYKFDGIRFLGCGEYGSDGRPHYHIILFNCPLDDFKTRHPMLVDGVVKNIHIFDKSTGRIPLLYSPTIGELWKKGSCPIGEVNFKTCAYVARYIMKKQVGQDEEYYHTCDVLPPFLRMSRRPGIGFDYYQEHYDKILEDGRIVLNRGDKVVTMKPNKYFYKLVLEDDPDIYYRIKALNRQDLYDSIYCKNYDGVELTKSLVAAENDKLNSVTALKRKV